jgi:hypothetical protein
MTLHLVVHRPNEPAGSEAEALVRAALRDAVWEVADSHWAPGGAEGEAVLVSSDLSPDYLVSHFRRATARRGFPDAGLLMVVQVGERAAWAGIGSETGRWIEETR